MRRRHSLQLNEPWGMLNCSMCMQETLVREQADRAENAGPGIGMHPHFVKLGVRFRSCRELILNPAGERRILTLFVCLLQMLG
jgi:hypothetical protein